MAKKNDGDPGDVLCDARKTEDVSDIEVEEVEEAQGGLTDAVGVPYYINSAAAPRPSDRKFIHHFFVPKAVHSGQPGYHIELTASGKAKYQLELEAAQRYVYPPFTFDRRLTMNNWRILLTEAMLVAGLRLAALQANLQAIMAIISNPIYGDVPFVYKITWLGLLAIAFVIWFLLAANRAYRYRDFIHPDTKFRRLLAISGSAILVMFAIPNDVVLLPIHALPLQLGGLLAESSCIEGNWRWPVLTLAHSSKPDHDFTNHAGVSIQLPLFWIVDLGCTGLNIAIATKYGILNYTALIQMCLCSLYALHKTYQASERFVLRKTLIMIWRKTACDPLMSPARQQAAVAKYIAEGGNARLLEEEQQRRVTEVQDTKKMTLHSESDATKASLKKSWSKASLLLESSSLDILDREDTCDLIGDKSGVPWFTSDEVVNSKHRVFIHTFFVPKEKDAQGGYTVKKKADGSLDYELQHTKANELDYPPATYDRRVTQNNWQEMLTMCMLEAGLRNAGLQANVMMAILMLENPQYEQMSYTLWILFVALLLVGLMSWAAFGLKRAMTHWEFIHPDSKFNKCLAVASSALLMMFAMPNDVVLFPIHLLPMDKGGLLCESGVVDGSAMWPVHTIAHYSKADHDFINTNDANTQLPLFIFIDIGCTVTNLVIAIQLGVFNFTALLQMCTCGAYAFVKLREIFLRWRLRHTLLNLWMRTAADPQMSLSRREAAKSKYQLIGGAKKKLEQACRQEEKQNPETRNAEIGASFVACTDPH